MPIRQEIWISETMLITRFDKWFSLQSRLCALIIFGVIALASTAQVFAQEKPKPDTQASPSPAAMPPPGQTPPDAPTPPKPVAIYNLLQRKSIVFPDIAYSTERLSVGQKFKLFVDNSISVDAITWSVLGSAVGQADNSPTGFEQGWDGYAKRFGAAMGRESSSEFFGTFIIASALHEDPRFYAEIDPPFFHAVKYSLKHVFVMQNDDGHLLVKARRPFTGGRTGKRVLPGPKPHSWRYLFSLWSGFREPGGWKYAARVLAGVSKENQPQSRVGPWTALTVLET
jgi:hypothetical protein